MFTRQKIATVSGLVGSLAVICVGAAYAHADEPRSECRNTVLGDTICVRKSDTHDDKHGAHALRQTRDCSVIDRPRVVFPDDGLLSGGTRNVGPTVDCSNKAQLPKGFEKPRFKKPRISKSQFKAPKIKAPQITAPKIRKPDVEL
ncbi:hypothetical protein GCM10010260_03070 [Streptomyces filipinensis]|uniref:Secreted protein n=1 Tax=Streptomyces filipinensis TaxID=66887 RepID=A0A918M8X5_9ACTN|nr:hypothetical protein [Streptomyces filipinensis]GGU74602.1 hypothetical protein GCM10010260_03070 [Streptomyces filipinensis]